MPNQADSCQGAGACILDLCRRHCDGTGYGCSSGACVPFSDGYAYCLASCNVLAPSCSGNDGCYAIDAATQACVPAGPGSKGASCSYPNDCAATLGCDLNNGICRAYCDASSYPNQQDPLRCAATETCVPTSYQPAIGLCTPTN